MFHWFLKNIVINNKETNYVNTMWLHKYYIIHTKSTEYQKKETFSDNLYISKGKEKKTWGKPTNRWRRTTLLNFVLNQLQPNVCILNKTGEMKKKKKQTNRHSLYILVYLISYKSNHFTLKHTKHWYMTVLNECLD